MPRAGVKYLLVLLAVRQTGPPSRVNNVGLLLNKYPVVVEISPLNVGLIRTLASHIKGRVNRPPDAICGNVCCLFFSGRVFYLVPQTSLA